MSNIRQESRILIKRSTSAGEVPTIPTSSEHTDGTWLPTDLYEGELFINIVDEKVWFRSGLGIQQIYPASVSGSQDVFLYDDLASFPITGTVDKLYIAKDTSNGYWWNSTIQEYELVGTTASVSWLSITGGPNSTPVQIDATVNASHSINSPNASHYTKLESDAVAGTPGAKVDKVDGYGLSQNDFTDAYKAILDAGISQVVIENTKAEFPIPGSLSVAYFARVDKQIWLWDDGIMDYTQLYEGVIDELSELIDVSLTGVADGQILRYNTSTSKWENATNQLGELVDVNLVGVVDGQILQYNATTTKWENVDSSGGGTTSPAGSNTEIQFNNSGSFGASSNLTYSSDILTLKGIGTDGDTVLDIKDGTGVTSAFTVSDNGVITTRSVVVKPLDNDGFTNAIGIVDVDNNPLLTIKDDGLINFDYLAGTTDRVVEINSTGGVSASKEFVPYVIDVTVNDTQSRNLTTQEWIGNTFERDGIEGQWGISGNYEYRCVSSFGLWTRYPANKEYQDVFISDGDVIGSLMDETNWDYKNQYVETDTLILDKIHNGQWYFCPFNDTHYFVYDISAKKILKIKTTENIYKEVSGIITDGSLVIVPAGYRLTSIVAREIDGLSGVTINIGATVSGSEVATGSITAGGTSDFALLESFFDVIMNKQIYISSSLWDDAKVNVYVKMERVM